MPMGRERAVLRWDARTAQLRLELDRIDRELARTDSASSSAASERRARLEHERASALSRLRALGPSPHAKMG